MTGNHRCGNTRRRLTRGRLDALLGVEVARELLKRWGRHALPAYNPAHDAREARNVALVALIDAGTSYAAAARVFGLSASSAKRIANMVRA